MRRLIAILLSLLPLIASAQYNLIPEPRSLTVLSEKRVQPGRRKTVKLKVSPADSLKEWYSIRIKGGKITTTAYTEQGLLWAERTLEQLRQSDGTYPQVYIEDYPEFPLRGFMYDSGRNFIEVSQVKEYIELISRYKLNVFHWHLTDRPAWRIECKAYPQLNEAKYQRPGRDCGRFYTYDEILDVIAFATSLGVMVIPEIDMPGHSDFFDTTFGCKMNSAQGMKILDTCIKEFFSEIPVERVPYIHIGSDEVRIDNPEEFMDWAVNLVEDAGRQALVWDPGLPAHQGVIHQVWRDGSDEPEPLRNGNKMVDSFMGYLNYVDAIMFPAKMFLHSPCYTGKSSGTELGGILCLWNDVRVDDNSRIAPHSGMMGGVLPFAERFWNGGVVMDRFREVLVSPDNEPMKKLEDFQSRMQYHKEHYLAEEMDYWFPNRPSVKWDLQIFDAEGKLLKALPAYGDMIDLDAICRLHAIKEPALCKAVRRFDLAEPQSVMLRIGYDAPARSNRNSDGIAQQGAWENYGTVMINGMPVAPPLWQEPGAYQFHFNTWSRPEEEIPFTDEQLYWMREPVKADLKAGENVVELSVRRHYNGQRFQFAVLGLPL